MEQKGLVRFPLLDCSGEHKDLASKSEGIISGNNRVQNTINTMLQISPNPHSQSSLSAWLLALQLSPSKRGHENCSKHKKATQGEITAPKVIESSQGTSD